MDTNFPTPEEMKQRSYKNHGLAQEQIDELEIMLRHKIAAGHREFLLYFNNVPIDSFAAFKFLRLMDYDVVYQQGQTTGTNSILVKI